MCVCIYLGLGIIIIIIMQRSGIVLMRSLWAMRMTNAIEKKKKIQYIIIISE